MSSKKRRIEKREELLVAKPLIVNISNKAKGMFNASEPLEAFPSEGFRWNLVQPIGMKPGVVWTR